MASFQELKSGKVRASICVNGLRDTGVFPTKQKAKSWARDREAALSKVAVGIIDDSRTIKDLFERYADEVSPQKEGAQWEIVRLKAFCKKYEKLCSIRLVQSVREDFEDWIQLRIRSVKPSTVNRELNLMSHALTEARRWRWISHNPMADLKRPSDPLARFRRISDIEIQKMCMAMGYEEASQPTLKREFVAIAFLFAIEMAMRAGEICRLMNEDVDFDNAVAHLKKTKNGSSRDVPLSPRAIELLKKLPPASKATPIFQLSSGALSSTFRKYRLLTDIEDLTFHDTRHEATTRLADKFHMLELASITGHRNLNELLTYYNKTGAELATKFSSSESAKFDSKARTTRPANAHSENDYSEMAHQLMRQLAKAGGLAGAVS